MADRLTPERDGRRIALNRDESASAIDAGVMVMINEDGDAVAAFEQADRFVIGVAVKRAAAGDKVAECATGIFRFDNSATLPVNLLAVGGLCYVENDRTVKGSGATPAGLVFDVDDAGVWVEIGPRTGFFAGQV